MTQIEKRFEHEMRQYKMMENMKALATNRQKWCCRGSLACEKIGDNMVPCLVEIYIYIYIYTNKSMMLLID